MYPKNSKTNNFCQKNYYLKLFKEDITLLFITKNIIYDFVKVNFFIRQTKNFLLLGSVF